VRENDTRMDVAFDKVVSVDGWFAVSDAADQYSFFTDVVFGQGTVGTEQESQVQFDLSLSGADIIVTLPVTEPAEILPSSISYDTPNIEFASTNVVAKKLKHRGELGFELDLSREKNPVSLTVVGNRANDTSRLNETTVTQRHLTMRVMHSRTSNGDNRWSVSDGLNGQLIGRPWDAKTEPRLDVKDFRTKKHLSIGITVRVQCEPNQLTIQNIRLKSTSVWLKFVRSPFQSKKLKVAQAYILSKLVERGLLESDGLESNQQLILAKKQAELNGR